MKALHGQGFTRDSYEENVEGIRGDRFLGETGGETCGCDEPVYFKECNPAAGQVSAVRAWQSGFVKKKVKKYLEMWK